MAEGVDGSQRPRRWPAGRRDGRRPGRARPHTVLGLRRPPPAGAVRWDGLQCVSGGAAARATPLFSISFDFLCPENNKIQRFIYAKIRKHRLNRRVEPIAITFLRIMSRIKLITMIRAASKRTRPIY